MKQISLYGAYILCPLLLDVDQGPLTATKGEVLETGQGEVLILRQGGHPIRWHITPAGRAASSTVTM